MESLTIGLFVVIVALNIILLWRFGILHRNIISISGFLDKTQSGIERLDRALAQGAAENYERLSRANMELRTELNNLMNNYEATISRNFNELGQMQRDRLDDFVNQIKIQTETLYKTLNSFQTQLNNNASDIKGQLEGSLKQFNDTQKDGFKLVADSQSILNTAMEQRLDRLRDTVDDGLKRISEENVKKLEEMRVTVDEKLQITLERRIGESFKQVSERLDQVHKGLGEMQNLAVGVGDLKRVLSNIKTRGILGEVQLGNILSQILSPNQYEENVAVKSSGSERVEFAIKLPGKTDGERPVYLPIDAKFPMDVYNNLVAAHESGSGAQMDEATQGLSKTISKCANDIHNKYINPPDTTDFAIMFLPVEGLFAEVVCNTKLVEKLQREFKVIVTGPTTLAAILNSLQMGFRTLAVEKRSSEVWKILGAVKTEFGKFGDLLKKTQEKLNAASKDLDDLVGARTRKIQTKLKSVDSVSESESAQMLDFDKTFDKTMDE